MDGTHKTSTVAVALVMLVVGLIAGFFIGQTRGGALYEREQLKAAEEASLAAQQRIAEEVNPFSEDTAVNPFDEEYTNPFEGAATNPFAK